MTMNGGTLYRRIEDLVFICDAAAATLDMLSDIVGNSGNEKYRDVSMSLYGVVTNIRHVRRELNDTLDKIEGGVITEKKPASGKGK